MWGLLRSPPPSALTNRGLTVGCHAANGASLAALERKQGGGSIPQQLAPASLGCRGRRE